MASAAVAFTVGALASGDDPIQLNLKLESSRPTDTSSNRWQHVREELLTLNDVNVVSQLDRTQYAYRLSLQPTTASNPQESVAFPFYLEAPALPPNVINKDDVCPLEIGAFIVTSDRLQCHSVKQKIEHSSSIGHSAIMLGGTLVAALLLYFRARSCKRQLLLRMKTVTNSSAIPTTPIRAGRRPWDGSNENGMKPAGAYRNELRERKTRPLETKSTVGSDYNLTNFPDYNDERGWRDFFDSQIYHNKEEQHQTTKALSCECLKDVTLGNSRHHRRNNKTIVTEARSERYKAIKDRIDRAAMAAAIDEAQKFWQM